MRELFAIFFLIFTIFILLSCDKNKDETLPLVTFSQPAENKIVNVFDTVVIQAQVKDEAKLELIEVGFADENFIPVLGTYSVKVKSNNQTVYFEYPITDKFLESGDYYFFIRAFDGINEKYKYRKVRLYGIEKKYKGLIIAASDNSGTIIDHIDKNGNINNKQNLPADFSSMSVNSAYQQYSVAGSLYENFKVFEFESDNLLWKKTTVQNPPSPYYIKSKVLDRNYYISKYNGELKSYNHNGVEYKNYTIQNGFYAKDIYLLNGLLIFNELNIGNQQKRIELFYVEGSGLKNQFYFQYDLLNIFSKSDNELVFFANNQNGGEILIYKLDENNTWSHKTLNDNIIDVAQVDNNNFVLCTHSDLFWYKYSNSNLVSISSLSNAKSIEYDEVNNLIIVAHNSGIEFFDFPSANSVSFVSYPELIMDMKILNNI